MKTRLFKKGDIIERNGNHYQYKVVKCTIADYVVYESYPRSGVDGGIPMDKALQEFTLVTPHATRAKLKAQIKRLEESNANLRRSVWSILAGNNHELCRKEADELKQQLADMTSDRDQWIDKYERYKHNTRKDREIYDNSKQAVAIVDAMETFLPHGELWRNEDGWRVYAGGYESRGEGKTIYEALVSARRLPAEPESDGGKSNGK